MIQGTDEDMELDPEIRIMNEIYASLRGLDAHAQRRIMGWVLEKLSLDLPRHASGDAGWEVAGPGDAKSRPSVADLFSKVRPKNDAERVLTAAVYLQTTQPAEELAAREITMKLTSLGHSVRNVTAVINSLMNKRPPLMIQTHKKGTTRQAQKRYKVTTEGIASVQMMTRQQPAC